jgi:RecA-family ATPase
VNTPSVELHPETSAPAGGSLPTNIEATSRLAPAAEPVRVDIAHAFRAPPAPLDFVLPGMLAGTVGAIVSPGGAGKSMFALQLGIFVTCGADLTALGGAVQPGRVLIIAAEDPALIIAHRLHALGQHLSPKQRNDVAELLEITAGLGRTIDVMDDAWLDWLVKHGRGKRLIVIDTLRRIHQLDENDSAQMARLLARLEFVAAATGAVIVFLHHASKAAALNGSGDMQQASRGSSVLTDNIRWQSYLTTMSTDEAKRHGVELERRSAYVRWGVAKQNYGRPVAEAWLERKEGGVLLPATLPKKSSGTPRQRTPRPSL